jgi:GAF domain-containing protein
VLERGQQLLGIGPAIDTHRTGRSVTVDDLTRNTDYAPLSHLLHGSPDEPAALPGGAGVRAVLSAPITIRGEVIGTLNGIRARPTPWTAQDIRAAQAYAGILGVLLRLGAPARERLGSTLHDDHEHDNEHGYPAQR